jgi:hypothetical protein
MINEDNNHLFNGFYRGKVVNNKDPLNSQRVKLRVIGLHSQNTSDNETLDGIPDDQLPWAEQGGMFLEGTYIPKIGDFVFLFFENGNHNKPVYFAKCRSSNDTPPEVDNIKDGKIGQPRTNETAEINHEELQIKVAKTVHGPKVEIRNTSCGAFIKLDTFNNKSRITISADLIEIDGKTNMGKGAKGYPLLFEAPDTSINLSGAAFRTSDTGVA